MELLIKAAAIGAVSALVGLAIKKSNPEISLLLVMAASAAVLTLALTMLSELRETLRMVMDFTSLQQTLVLPVLKCVAVGIVARLSADLCKDAGQSGLASAVELCGAAAALCISLPLVNTLLQTLGGLL
ncbi:MAG: stage III sporulation protein AD [Ruminococcaceae bacterium]|nr:stage III sporulation protein AD [Oscillospiraceae bacterium]